MTSQRYYLFLHTQWIQFVSEFGSVLLSNKPLDTFFSENLFKKDTKWTISWLRYHKCRFVAIRANSEIFPAAEDFLDTSWDEYYKKQWKILHLTIKTYFILDVLIVQCYLNMKNTLGILQTITLKTLALEQISIDDNSADLQKKKIKKWLYR